MKRHKYLNQKNNSLWIVIAIVVLIILAVIIISSLRSSDDIDAKEVEQEASQGVLEEQLNEEESPVLEPVKEESVSVTKKKVGEEGLCEDYFFEQEDELYIMGHTIVVERIAESSVRVTVDEQPYVLAEESNEYLGDGIRLSIKNGAIAYFGLDHSSNAIMIRVGCSYNTDPNEKYVATRGKQLCTEIYEACQDSFDIDLE